MGNERLTHPAIEKAYEAWKLAQIRKRTSFGAPMSDAFRAGFLACRKLAVEECEKVVLTSHAMQEYRARTSHEIAAALARLGEE